MNGTRHVLSEFPKNYLEKDRKNAIRTDRWYLDISSFNNNMKVSFKASETIQSDNSREVSLVLWDPCPQKEV